MADKQITVGIYNDVGIRMFSNGSEWGDWLCRNCNHCEKENQCDLLKDLVDAAFGDGKTPFSTVERIGYDYINVQRNALCGGLSECKERVVKSGTEVDNGN